MTKKSSKNRIIIFVKNQEAGKVKTRLAKSVGKMAALKVYQKLLEITERETRGVNAAKLVAYSEYVERDDLFSAGMYEKMIQAGEGLGERMCNAFEKSLEMGFEKIVLVGSDCPDIRSKHFITAFEKLESADVVIGPASDGGYYLIGLKKVYNELFKGISWSSPEVLNQTMEKMEQMELNYTFLKELSDIDTEKDLRESHLRL
jgi:uncharacterized protein